MVGQWSLFRLFVSWLVQGEGWRRERRWDREESRLMRRTGSHPDIGMGWRRCFSGLRCGRTGQHKLTLWTRMRGKYILKKEDEQLDPQTPPVTSIHLQSWPCSTSFTSLSSLRFIPKTYYQLLDQVSFSKRPGFTTLSILVIIVMMMMVHYPLSCLSLSLPPSPYRVKHNCNFSSSSWTRL